MAWSPRREHRDSCISTMTCPKEAGFSLPVDQRSDPLKPFLAVPPTTFDKCPSPKNSRRQPDGGIGTILHLMQLLIQKCRTVIPSRFGWGEKFWTGRGLDRVVLSIESCDLGSRFGFAVSIHSPLGPGVP